MSGILSIGNFSATSGLNSLGDASVNRRLFVGSDASFGGKLFTVGDASLNGNVSIANDLTVNGNMYIKAYTTRQMITELSYQLIIAEDISVNGRLFLSNDASINNRLFVGADASFGSRLFVAGTITANNGLSVTGAVTLPNASIADAALSTNIVTLTGSQTLTNKTLTGPVISTITNTGTLTLPTTTDTLVGRATTDTLTNKTLTTPIISSISNSGTITVPAGTLTLATLTGSETLTNKTITTSGLLTVGAGLAVTGADGSFNNRLFVGSDVSLGSRLFVTSDTSMNGNVSIAKDMTIGGNLYVKAYTTQQMITELSYQLIIAEDVSVNGRLFLSNDASINNRLFVGSDVSFGTRVFIAGDLSVNGNLNVNGNLTAVTQTSTDNSTKVATTAYVKTALGSVGASSYFATDVSMAARLYVISDVSFNGNAYIGKNLILGVSGQYSPFNLDVSGSLNFPGQVQGGISYPDGTLQLGASPPYDFSNNFCTNASIPPISPAAPASNFFTFAMSQNGQFQIATTMTGGIYSSINSGATWYLNPSAPTTGWGTCAMSANGQYQYALGTGSNFIYSSSNYGATWAQLETPPIAGAQFYGSIVVSATGQYLAVAYGTSSSLQQDSGYLGTTYAVSPTMYFSQNYGATWTVVTPPAAVSSLHSMAMSANGQYIYVSASSGFCSRNFGATWVTCSALINTVELSCSSNGKYVYMGNGNGLNYSSNFGVSFNSAGIGCRYIMISANGQYVISNQIGGNFYVSRNYGVTWKNLGYNYGYGGAISADGNLITCFNGTNIYTFRVPQASNLSITGTLSSLSDASFNGRLFVGSDVSFGGKLYVASTLTKGGGSFDIVHPDPSKSETTRLRHCFVEAPTRGDNMYRYKISAVDLSASFVLPSYYKFLNEDTQIWVNPSNCLGSGFGILENDNETVKITVSQDGDYNVLIIGTRKDQMMIDFFDNAGGVEYKIANINTDISGN